MSLSYYRPGPREAALLRELEVLRRTRVKTWPADFARRVGYGLKIPQRYKQLRWEIFRYAEEVAPEKVKGQLQPERPDLPPPHNPYVMELEQRVRDLQSQLNALRVEKTQTDCELRDALRVIEALRAANIELYRRVETTKVPGSEAEFLGRVKQVLEGQTLSAPVVIDLATERARRT